MKDQTKEKHFHRRDAVNHPTDWTCNYCDKTLKCLIAPGRARDHLSGGSKNVAACKSVPDAVFNEMLLQRKEKDDQQKALDKTKAAKAELKKRVLEGAEQSGGSKKQTSIAAMETKMRSDLDQQWSRFVFHAGVPFHLTEDPELDEFFIMYERFIVAGLRNWGTPDRKKIGKALDTEYETLKTQVFKEYFANDDYTTMARDGWSNVRSQPVLNYTITGRKGTVFMHAEYPKLVKKDAEYVAQKLVEAKQIYESLNVGSQLTTIVQDNASVMSAANVVLDDKQKEEMGYLTKIGCVLHSYSLLFKDMLKIGPTKNAADTAVLIAKGFKNRTRPRDLVDDKQLALNMKRTPAPLPAETRMGNRFITVRWVLKNKAALQAAVVDPEWLAEDSDLRDTVLHPDTWLQMEMFTSLLRPLWKLMRRADTDGPGYVMCVYHDMLNFQVHVENWVPPQKMKFSASDLKYLRTCVIDRWKFLHQPVYSVAYLCNPQLHATANWQCSELLKDLRSVMHAFAGDKASKALLQLQDYRLKYGDFADSLLWTEEATKGSALSWWDLWGGGVPELQDVLKRVFSITCVTSGAERNWSIFGFLHS